MLKIDSKAANEAKNNLIKQAQLNIIEVNKKNTLNVQQILNENSIFDKKSERMNSLIE